MKTNVGLDNYGNVAATTELNKRIHVFNSDTTLKIVQAGTTRDNEVYIGYKTGTDKAYGTSVLGGLSEWYA